MTNKNVIVNEVEGAHNDDPMCPHFFLKQEKAMLPQQLVVTKGAAASYDDPIIVHLIGLLLVVNFQIK